MSKKRFVVIHGHFYQPPRENPWTEAIDRQESAAPHHDWNDRIAWECYVPNGNARVMGPDGRIAELVNNYANISFNFGPTLLSWFQEHFPEDYERLLAADRDSLKARGHGNAIAQAFNHMILPLANARDQLTQVLWGIEDFHRRFGRAPEALWMPETAANVETLALLAEHGMRYVILSPLQVEKVRPAEGEWQDVSSGGPDPRRPYRVQLPDGTWMPAFFYDHGLASAVAFEKLMTDAGRAAGRIEGAFDPAAEDDQLVHIATDGESYGHHHAFADQCLAYLLTHELPKRGIEVTNYAAYLEAHPPVWEASLKPGADGKGTAWSCAHGVGRWREDCGCGDAGTSQAWRAPLRESLDWLRDAMAEGFEKCGLFKDPWKARNEYIEVILDRATREAFLRRHLSQPASAEASARAVKWLELQRHALLMYTSCGWFFSEISGLESVQCLQYAARALQLFRELGGADLEPGLLERLAKAPSNRPEFGDGRRVYEKLVRTRVVTPETLAAYFAFTLFFDGASERRRLTRYTFEKGPLVSRTAAATTYLAGTVRIVSGVTGESWERAFLALARPHYDLQVFVAPASDAKGHEAAQGSAGAGPEAELASGFEDLRSALFSSPVLKVGDLLPDEREEILELASADVLAKLQDVQQRLHAELFPVLERKREWGMALPKALRSGAEFAVDHDLLLGFEQARRAGKEASWDAVLKDLTRARELGLEPPLDATERFFEELVAKKLAALERDLSLNDCRALAELLDTARRANLVEWKYRTENRLFALLHGAVLPRLEEIDQRPLEPARRETFAAFFDLCEAAGIDAGPARAKLEPRRPRSRPKGL